MSILFSTLWDRTFEPARRGIASSVFAAAFLVGGVEPVQAQSDPYVGQLALFAIPYCPKNWAEANGALQSIAQNTALFSLLGTTFGGDGRTTFALPDLRGRTPVGLGQGLGLVDVQMGEIGGAESVTIQVSQMPTHAHNTATAASTQPATDATPGSGKVLAQTMNAGAYATAAADTLVGGTISGAAGGSQPLGIRSPYLGMRWCIALYGVFPSRN